MSEQDRYKRLYKTDKQYGHHCHGKGALPYLAKYQAKSIIDVGCGGNEFLQLARRVVPAGELIGCDFASPFADIKCSATAIPCADKQFDYVTSFDMLEHLLPEEVDLALSEMARVSERFLVSICYKPSKRTFEGENMHPTVRTEEWWISRIMRAGGTCVEVKGRYILGKWNKPLRIDSKASVLLVGNGPSLLELDNRYGKIIDSFDEVVRFNRYIIQGMEDKLGSKTTLWSTYGHGRTPLLPGEVPMPVEDRPKRVIYTHGECGTGPSYTPEELYGIPHWFWNHMTRSVRSRFSWLNGFQADPTITIPSSGLLVTAWMLDVLGVEKVTLVGFDHFSKERSKIHHYWRPIPMKAAKEHDHPTEQAMFADLLAAGRISYLSL
jgi:SAM-dependent methyltransferase